VRHAPNLRLSPHTPAERQEQHGSRKHKETYMSSERNLSSGYHRQRLSLSYLLYQAVHGGDSSPDWCRLRNEIFLECDQLGIEPMSESEVSTYDGSQRGHPD